MSEVNFEFAKTMNRIVFDKHIKAKGPNTIAGPLSLPALKGKPVAPKLGMIVIPKNNYAANFSNFLFETILASD